MRMDDRNEERSTPGSAPQAVPGGFASARVMSRGERRGGIPSASVRRRIADGLGVDVLTVWPGYGLDGKTQRAIAVVAP